MKRATLATSLAASALGLIFTTGAYAQQDEQVAREDLRKQLKNSILTADQAAAIGATSQCVIWQDMAINVAPFDSEVAVDEFVDALEWEATPRYQVAARWTTTATNGSGIQIRTPITLTYSFVPDGTEIPAAGSVAGSTTGPSSLFADMNAAYAGVGGEATWKANFAAAFNRIGDLTGINYVEVSDDGSAFASASGTNAPGFVRGDIRISMRPFAGSGGVLAYNFFPNNSDMVIDKLDMSLWTSTSGNLPRVAQHAHARTRPRARLQPRGPDRWHQADGGIPQHRLRRPAAGRHPRVPAPVRGQLRIEQHSRCRDCDRAHVTDRQWRRRFIRDGRGFARNGHVGGLLLVRGPRSE
jgi:hypothetical protein